MGERLALGLIAQLGALVVTGVAALLARRTPATVRHSIWRAGIILALGLPFVPFLAGELSVRPYSIAVPFFSTRSAGPRPVERAMSQQAPTASQELRSPESSKQPSAGGARVIGTDPAQMRRSDPFPTVLLLAAIWALGALAMLVLAARDVARARRLGRAARPICDPVLGERLAAWCRSVGLRTQPVLAECAGVGVPTVAGWPAAVLVFPAGFRFDDKGADAVVVHELAHVRRLDALAVAVAHVARALFWWHPLVWLAAAQLRATAEEACDDWAVSLTEEREQYAQILVTCAERATMVGGLAASRSGAVLLRRVQRILTGRGFDVLTPSWIVRLGIALCCLGLMGVAGGLELRPAASGSTVGTDQGPGDVARVLPEPGSQIEVNGGYFYSSARPQRQTVGEVDLEMLERIGVPAYPDAIGLGSGGNETWQFDGMLSLDDPEDVIAWYRERMGGLEDFSHLVRVQAELGQAGVELLEARGGVGDLAEAEAIRRETVRPTEEAGLLLKVGEPHAIQITRAIDADETVIWFTDQAHLTRDALSKYERFVDEILTGDEPGQWILDERAKWRQTECASHMKQLALCALRYTEDHDDRFPPEQWVEALRPYYDYERFDDLFVCPEAPEVKMAFAMNAALAGRAISEIQLPAQTVLFFESDAADERPAGGPSDAVARHGDDLLCVAFVDGHAKGYRLQSVQEPGPATGLFWQPDAE